MEFIENKKKQFKVNKIIILSIINVIARITLGLIFVFAAYSKIIDPHDFQKNVASYHILIASIVPAFSFILPWIELLTGVYLILGLFTKITSIFSMFLLLIFIYAISYAILTKQPVSGCGCFSQAPTELIGWQDVIRDIFFITLAFISLFTKSRLSIDSLLNNRRNKANV